MLRRRCWNTGTLATMCMITISMVIKMPGRECLKSVELEIEPRIVQRGSESRLSCTYDLEGAVLYTVKWYRGTHEFYRYTPSDQHNTKIFPYAGVHVDLQMSNEHQVVLRNVGFNLSGNFSCEVTTDAPHFSTAVVSKEMLVVVIPEHPPVLSVEKDYYIIGDVLHANCSSQPSRPAASLTLMINNDRVCEKCASKKHVVQDLYRSDIYLDLPLFPLHFNEDRLLLRCIAQIGELYQKEAGRRLDNYRNPTSQRVSLPNSSTFKQNSIRSALWIAVLLICAR